MTTRLTIDYVASFLGLPSLRILSASPFSEWSFHRSEDEDLDIRIIDYECRDKRLEFASDIHDNVQSVFLFADDDRNETSGELNRGKIELADLPFETSRQLAYDRLGVPDKSGSKSDHPYLGKRGPWDRFLLKKYALHIQFHYSKNSIKQITLMRLDIIPK